MRYLECKEHCLSTHQYCGIIAAQLLQFRPLEGIMGPYSLLSHRDILVLFSWCSLLGL